MAELVINKQIIISALRKGSKLKNACKGKEINININDKCIAFETEHANYKLCFGQLIEAAIEEIIKKENDHE